VKNPFAGLTMGHGSAIFTHGLPTLLRATTPTQSYSHTSDLEQNEDKLATPTALQALVSHVQPVQTVTSAGSAVHLNSSGSALPLTAFTLPRASGTGVYIHTVRPPNRRHLAEVESVLCSKVSLIWVLVWGRTK
jgi:hypothetical protein